MAYGNISPSASSDPFRNVKAAWWTRSNTPRIRKKRPAYTSAVLVSSKVQGTGCACRLGVKYKDCKQEYYQSSSQTKTQVRGLYFYKPGDQFWAPTDLESTYFMQPICDIVDNFWIAIKTKLN